MPFMPLHAHMVKCTVWLLWQYWTIHRAMPAAKLHFKYNESTSNIHSPNIKNRQFYYFFLMQGVCGCVWGQVCITECNFNHFSICIYIIISTFIQYRNYEKKTSRYNTNPGRKLSSSFAYDSYSLMSHLMHCRCRQWNSILHTLHV